MRFARNVLALFTEVPVLTDLQQRSMPAYSEREQESKCCHESHRVHQYYGSLKDCDLPNLLIWLEGLLAGNLC